MNKDFRETLEQTARAYLRRYIDRYLGDEQQLLNQAAAQLIQLFQLTQQQAMSVVERVYAGITLPAVTVYADLSASTADQLVLINPVTGCALKIPIQEIARHYFRTG